MSPSFLRFKPRIDTAIVALLESGQRTARYTNRWGSIASGLLSDFCVRGKSVRGCLLVLTYQMFERRIEKDVLDAAAALEILHSSLLIHDDLMDRDRLRRGKPSIHVLFESLARKNNIHDIQHFGRSMAECVGDLGFFTAFSCLSKISASPLRRNRLLMLFSGELQSVVIAQMQDVAWGLGNEAPSQKDIELMNRFKTARYTFSLPLVAGAILASQNQVVLTKLEKLGEACGLAYQLRDDYLGLFGTESATGKPQGSDMKEGKRNIAYFLLSKAVRGSDTQRLSALWGGTYDQSDRTQRLVALAKSYGLKERMETIIARYQRRAYHLIDTLPLGGKDKIELSAVVRFLSERTS